MAHNDRISAPQSQTGLMRFSDVSSSTIQIDPRIIIAICAVVIVAELIFHAV